MGSPDFPVKHTRTRVFLCKFGENLEYTFARCEKYSSKLDISRSLIRIFEVNSNILLLAMKNIQVNLIFLARLYVYLQYELEQTDFG